VDLVVVIKRVRVIMPTSAPTSRFEAGSKRKK
jgi:hypothetical protein